MAKKLVRRLPGISYDLKSAQAALTAFLNQHPMNFMNQINLTCKRKNASADDLYHGVGSLYDFEKKCWRESEKDYQFLNPILCGTFFEKIDSDLRALFPQGVGRIRLMKLKPKSCYSFHVDNCQRVHLALQTDGMAYLAFPGKPKFPKLKRFFSSQCELSPSFISKHYQIPADGCLYLTDTRDLHTAMNVGNVDRIHLVASVF